MNMKKLVFFVCLILTAELLSAQLYSGIKSCLAFPLNNEQEIDYGIGAGLQLGYSVGEHFDLEIGAGNVSYKSMFQNYRVRSVEAGARYSVFNYPVKPFIGFGTGYFQKKFDGPFDSEFSENGIGIVPSAGAVFDVKTVKNLSVITEISYNKIFFKHQLSVVSVNLGVYYSFKRN